MSLKKHVVIGNHLLGKVFYIFVVGFLEGQLRKIDLVYAPLVRLFEE